MLFLVPFGVVAAEEDQKAKNNQDTTASTTKGDLPTTPTNKENENTEQINIQTPASVTGEIFDGSATVVDFTTTGSRAFYTIKDKEDKVFYLIIDLEKPSDNVYFLTEINGSDLKSNNNKTFNIVVDDAASPPKNTDKETDNDNAFYMTVAIIMVLAAAGYYFFIKKKKHNKTQTEEEEMNENYEDDFIEYEYSEEQRNEQK